MSILKPPLPIIGQNFWGYPVFAPSRSLADRVNEAISWGNPDSESIGFTTAEFIGLLREQRERIRELEAELSDLRSKK